VGMLGFVRGGVSAVMVIAALALAPGAVAAGQSPVNPATNPLSPGLPLSPAGAPTTTTAPQIPNTSTTPSGDSGLSGTNAIAIGLGALIVIGGISFYIWRDARRRAPVRRRAAGLAAAEGPGSGRSSSKQRAKGRKLSPAERRRRKRGRAR